MNLMTYQFDNATVRTLKDAQGEPWFVAADVCAALEIANTSLAVNGNPTRGDGGIDPEDRGVATVNTPSGAQQVLTVNESGLYALIFKSRKPEAKAFKRWVTHEVLPSIRKAGSYGKPANDPAAVLADPAALRGLLLGYTEKVLALEATVAEQAPKVEALNQISQSEGSRCITDAAKVLGIPPRQLFTWMEMKQWIFRRTPGAPWQAYQGRIATYVLEHKTKVVQDSDGKDKTVWQVLVTPRGLVRLAELQAREDMQSIVAAKEKAA